jgi:hypothetical protein
MNAKETSMNAIAPLSSLIDTSANASHVAQVNQLQQDPRTFPFDEARGFVSLGWSVFPQERHGSRRPGRVFGQPIKWVADHDLTNCPPSEQALALWVTYCADCNVAMVNGPASGHTFTVDVDVTDEKMAMRVREIILEELGETPFRRVGEWPKVAMIYRHAADDGIKSVSRRFKGSGGHAIEILGAGKPITIWGVHHKTGRWFQWENGLFAPCFEGPEKAPLVTSAQVEALLGRLDFEFNFVDRAASADISSIDVGDTDGIRICMPSSGDWKVSDGRVSDGREAYLFNCVNSISRANADAINAARAMGDDALGEIGGRLAAAVEVLFRDTAAMNQEWEGKLLPDIADKVRRLLGKVKSGDIALRVRRIVEPRLDTAQEAAPADGKKAVRIRRTPLALPDNGLPIIQIEVGEIEKVVSQAEAALINARRGVYQRGGDIVSLGEAPVQTAYRRDVVAKRIFSVGTNALVEHLSASANWTRYDARSEDIVRTEPTPKIAATLRERVGRWNLQVLAGFASAPTLRCDGSLLSSEGYDAQTGLVVDFGGVTFPSVKEAPTRDEALAALAKLKGMISTFPFVENADRSVAISAMLTAVVRRTLRTAPLHAYTAPVAGSGKSTLVDIASIMATGREAGVIAQGADDGETEKRLASVLLAGDAVVAIDNVDAPLGGDILCQMLTQPSIRIRILGRSETPELSTNALVTATGQNLLLLGDMTRRGLPCRLDPGCERPELRVFEKDPLVEAKKQRGELVAAALTVMRAYIVAGMPAQATPLGSFGDWSRLVRNSLLWLGEADPCATMDYARAMDPKLDAIRNVFAAWSRTFGTAKLTVSDIIHAATAAGDTARPLYDALAAVAGAGGVLNPNRLGRWLAQQQGRIVSGQRVVRDGERHRVVLWRLDSVKPARDDVTEADGEPEACTETKTSCPVAEVAPLPPTSQILPIKLPAIPAFLRRSPDVAVSSSRSRRLSGSRAGEEQLSAYGKQMDSQRQDVDPVH